MNTQLPVPQTFRAPNVMSALEKVQREIGPEAIVVSVRQVPPEAPWQVWRPSEVEVLAVAPSKKKQLSAPSDGAKAPKTQPAGSDGPAAAGQQPASGLAEPLANLLCCLLEQGLDEDLLKRTAAVCKETLNPRFLTDEVHLQHYLTMQLQAQIRVSPNAISTVERAVCLIGSSGSGKTNLCAKLAAHHKQQLGRSVVWVCADTLSAGAIAEADLYTRAMGIPLHIAYTPAELAEIVRSQSDADLVLVDTQACNPYNEGSVVQLGEYLTALPHRSTYLVLSATSKDMDLKKSYASLKSFSLNGFAFTHLDETNTFGNVFNLACHSRLPLAFFSAGPIVPDDLQPAGAEYLTKALFRRKWTQ